MTVQDTVHIGIWMNDATRIHLTIQVTVVILPHWNSTPGPDDAAQTGDMHAESRTRQEHAADAPAGPPADGE